MRVLITKLPSLQVVLTAWIAFIAFGTALAVLTPLGEGFDEPWHFAYIQRVAQVWDVPMGHSDHISEEVAQFLQHHPVSWGLHSNNPALMSYEDYWRADPSLREKQDRTLRSLRFSGRYVEAQDGLSGQYERHQPPLYYVISAPIFVLASHSLSLANSFLAMRLWSVLLASLLVPGAFFLAIGIFDDKPWVKSILLLTILFPGLYPGVIRVANDALAVPLATWMFACIVHFFETERRAFLVATTALLIAGLWTKAFFIPLLIGTVLSLLIFKHFRQAMIVLLVAAIIGSGWYVYNYQATGSLTGLPEAVKSGSSVGSSLQTLGQLDWRNLVNVVRFSHIWVGNWSFLNVRGWMYRLVSWLFLAGAFGCVLGWRSGMSLRALVVLGVNYLLFIAALLYYATQVFQNGGISVAEGWYLTLLIPVEAVLFVTGVRSYILKYWPAVVAAVGFLLLALTVYANLFVMIPYYSGMTAHAESGHLQTYHPAGADAGIILQHLLRYHPWLPSFVPALLIAAFVAIGVSLAVTLLLSTREVINKVNALKWA
jgi:hypothetical protein